jgi:hypothetical protein
MAASLQTLETIQSMDKDYAAGFITDIEMDFA